MTNLPIVLGDGPLTRLHPQQMRQLFQYMVSMQPKRLGLWVTMQDAAEYTGLSRGILLRAIEAGRITGSKCGNRWRIRRLTLDQLDSLEGLAEVGRKINRARESIRTRKAAV